MYHIINRECIKVCIILEKTSFTFNKKCYFDPETLVGKCQRHHLPAASLHNSHGHIAWKCEIFFPKLVEYFIFTCSYLMCIQGKL